jgi:hypothetical protein
VLADRTDAALAPGDYAHPIIVKESGLAPTDNVRDLFAAFTRASGLPRLP